MLASTPLASAHASPNLNGRSARFRVPSNSSSRRLPARAHKLTPIATTVRPEKRSAPVCCKSSAGYNLTNGIRAPTAAETRSTIEKPSATPIDSMESPNRAWAAPHPAPQRNILEETSSVSFDVTPGEVRDRENRDNHRKNNQGSEGPDEPRILPWPSAHPFEWQRKTSVHDPGSYDEELRHQ